MSEQHLFVSLGHNSSAAFSADGRVVRAYEQERIDRRKSSSAYPREAIELALGDAGAADVTYVSHWFDDLSLGSSKYLDMDHLRSVSMEVVGLTSSFTHHDAHATSAASFFRSNGGRADDAVVIVLDGFGTNQECFSVYHTHWPMHQYPRLVHRTYGYDVSLGLMYQYVVDYLGMKQNQDEYKLLGYEAHVLEHTDRAHALFVRSMVAEEAEAHATRMMEATQRPSWKSGLIDYEALRAAKTQWWERVDHWRKWFPDVTSENGVRSVVAFCAQTFLEFTVARLIDFTVPLSDTRPRPHLLLAGGCFYNVKLNRRIQRETMCRVFSHPLAGDQGAAMGFMPGLVVDGLCHGERVTGRRDAALPFGVEIVSEEHLAREVADRLMDNQIVNVVRGSMEYGPRALCNTTTFALPTRESVARINALNERDEAMPMAPVMTRGAALAYLNHSELLEVPVSDRFMITTVSFRNPPGSSMQGVAHKDPLDDVWTARPQVVAETGTLADLLRLVPNETLINTSFNYHGEPIVFTEEDACRTHEMQCQRATLLDVKKPATLLVRS